MLDNFRLFEFNEKKETKSFKNFLNKLKNTSALMLLQYFIKLFIITSLEFLCG